MTKSIPLHDRLRTLKRRLLAIGVGASMGWGLAGVMLLLFLCMWLDLALELPPMARVACGISSLVLGMVIVTRLAWSAFRRGAPVAMARRLDRAAGAQGQILAGVDLLFRPVAAAPGGGGSALTAGMAQIAVDRAAALVAQVAGPSAVPAKPLARPLLALIVLTTIAVIVALSVPGLAPTQWARFTDPFGDHPPFSRISLDVTPGNIKVVYGGTLDIRATARGETVDRLDLILKTQDAAEETLPMFPEPGGSWRATLTNVTAASRYYVRARGARSKRFDISVVTVPRLETVRFRITPPAYTHRPPIEGPPPQGGIAALPGTLVEVWAKSNRPLSGGELTADAPQGYAAPNQSAVPTTFPTLVSSFALKPIAAGADVVTGSFIVRNAGNLNLRVFDVNEQASTEPFTTTITLLRDERPFVRIMEPKPESFATPDITLNVEMAAEDDYGISRLELFRGLNESRMSAMDAPLDKSQPARFQATVPLPLSAYGLSPGDVVKLYARVEDNDPAGAKGFESPVITLRIISNEQMRQMQLAQEGLEVLLSKYEQATRAMEAASDRIDKIRKELEKLDPNSELAQKLRDELNEAADQMAADAEKLAQLAAEDLPFDVDQALKKHLAAAAQTLAKSAEAARKLAGKPGISVAGTMKELAEIQKKLGREREEYKEEAGDPIEHLGKVFPLIEDQARFIELYEHQKDLGERTTALVGHDHDDDPRLKARMRDLQAEQRQIRTDLRELLDDIENRAAELPADPALDGLRETAIQFAKAVRESPASDQMADAEAGLEEFAGYRAHKSARAAAETLEKFLAKCKATGDQGMACLKFQPKLSGSLGNTVQELLDAACLGQKPGQGMGNGGGYSARRSSLSNIGLYGRIPSRGQESRTGSGTARHGSSADGTGARTPGSPSDSTSKGRLNASGQSEAAVPDRYKRRVGEYFQRVSDELDAGQK